MSNFTNDVLKELEELIGTADLETLVRRDVESKDSAVKIIHRPSGLEFECNSYNSQVKNKTACLLQLLKSLKSNKHL